MWRSRERDLHIYIYIHITFKNWDELLFQTNHGLFLTKSFTFESTCLHIRFRNAKGSSSPSTTTKEADRSKLQNFGSSRHLKSRSRRW